MTTTTPPPEANPVEHDQYVSVTTVLNVIPKDALVPWAAGKVADEVIRDVEQSIEWARDMLLDLRQERGIPDGERTPMALRDKAEAEAWRRLRVAQAVLKDRRQARRQLVDARWHPDVDPDTGEEYAFTATGLGTTIHDVFDRWLVTGIRPKTPHPELDPYLDRLDEWLQTWQPEVILAEATLVNPKVGYAGRGDAVVRLPMPELDMEKADVMLDLKSRRLGSRLVQGQEVDSTPYPEGGYQTAAYSHATHVISWADAPRLAGLAKGSGRYYYVDPSEWEAAWEMPKVDAAAILLVTPDRATLHRVNWKPTEDEWAWDAFRFYLGSARAIYSRRHTNLVGPPMSPPYRPDHRTHGDTDLEARLRDSIPTPAPDLLGELAASFTDSPVSDDQDLMDEASTDPELMNGATVLAFPTATE